MTIKIQDLDSTFDDTSLINTEEDDNITTAAQLQKRQTLILKRICFLSAMSLAILITLPFSILNQDIRKVLNGNIYSLKYLASFLFISKTCASVMWGFISDRIGRKKALNISLIGSALILPLYGLCRSFNSLAFIYALLGIFSCSHIFIITMLVESNNKESRPKAFRSLLFTIYFGCIIGLSFSLIYDMTLDKATTSITGAPYIIPSLIASGINIAAYVISNRYLSETLTDKRAILYEYVNADISTDQIMISTKSDQIRIFGLKFSENSLLLIAVDSLLGLIYKGYSIISDDWSTIELSKGGLNLKFEDALAAKLPSSIILIAILYRYPYIYKKIGALKLFKAGFPAAGIIFILSLMLTSIAKTGSTYIVLSLFSILLTIKMGTAILINFSFNLLLAESAEVSGNLGTLYGISNTLLSSIDLVVYYTSIIFSDSPIESNLPFPLNYSCTWLLAIFSIIGCWLSSKIKNTA